MTAEEIREALNAALEPMSALGGYGPQCTILRRLLDSGFIEAAMAWSDLCVNHGDATLIVPVSQAQHEAYRVLTKKEPSDV